MNLLLGFVFVIGKFENFYVALLLDIITTSFFQVLL